MSSVSVFVPCYKYAHYLRGCVMSALMQRDVDVRVLILDDCSPDNTPEVAEELLNQDPRVEYRRHACNRGHIETYNEGIEWVSSDYILLLSADDMLTPGALARATRVMDENPQVVLTYGRDIRRAEFQFRDVPDQVDCKTRIASGPEFWRMCVERGGNIVSTPTAVARTAVHKTAGGYRKELPHSGDFEMWMRLAAYGSVGSIDAVQGFYRTHDRNMSHGFCELRDTKQKKAAFDAVVHACGQRMPEAAEILGRADRALAEQAFWFGSNRFDQGDLATSRECLAYALSLAPDLKDWGPWKRLRLKQLIGPAFWGVLRPTLQRVRGRHLARA